MSVANDREQQQYIQGQRAAALNTLRNNARLLKYAQNKMEDFKNPIKEEDKNNVISAVGHTLGAIANGGEKSSFKNKVHDLRDVSITSAVLTASVPGLLYAWFLITAGAIASLASKIPFVSYLAFEGKTLYDLFGPLRRMRPALSLPQRPAYIIAGVSSGFLLIGVVGFSLLILTVAKAAKDPLEVAAVGGTEIVTQIASFATGLIF